MLIKCKNCNKKIQTTTLDYEDYDIDPYDDSGYISGYNCPHCDVRFNVDFKIEATDIEYFKKGD